jgi:hypothetical protein
MNSFSATWPGRFVPRGSLLERRSRNKRHGALAHASGPGTSVSDAMQHRLFLIALQARAFLEPVWLEWHTTRGGDIPTPLSRTTCGRSSLFLKRVLQVNCPLPGGPRAYFGFHAGSDWQSHAWVETGNWIIDLTADQFGDEPVIVTARPDPRYQKGVSDRAFPEFVRGHRRAVEKLTSQWEAWIGKPQAGRQAV